MKSRLNLAPEMFPVQAFFNAIPSDELESTLNSLSNKIGYSINNCHCLFPDGLDSDEEQFTGVRFEIYDDQVTITIDEMTQIIETLRKDFC